MSSLTHALTVDVEDWFHVENLRGVVDPSEWPGMESRLEASMARLLDLLDEHGRKATFFILGKAVEDHPAVAREIVARGHEPACHGWSHELVYRQSPERFREETRRAKARLQDLCGVEVKGYRASTFSITERSLWALDILAEEGFGYDSSIAPLHRARYGIPGAPRAPHVRTLAGGRSIVEFPVSTMRVLGRDFPLGGGFFRLFPLRWTRRSLARHEAAGTSAMLYLHPWELDAGQPRLRGLPLANRFCHYARLAATEEKLGQLLRGHRWGTMASVLESHAPLRPLPR